MGTGPRRVDHLVVAVHDVDASATLFERMGFQVGPRNRHPWGTENRLVQLGSSYLELIAVAVEADVPEHGPRTFSFGAFVRDRLREREGLTMLALGSPDGAADAAELGRRGIGDFAPFSFERAGRRADGSAVRLGFTLAFARDPGLPEAAFFVCQHHRPEGFWDPALQEHPNGALDVTAVTLATAVPDEHVDFLVALTDADRPTDGRAYRLADPARLEVEPSADARGFTALTVRVADLEATGALLVRAGVPFDAAHDRLRVPASSASGVAVVFER